LSEVTVVATDATSSDGLATAVSAMGERDGLRLIDATRGTKALMGIVQADGTVRWAFSRGWRGH
jgi:thiamine biosynthesis lipoprotein ApbE